MQEDRILFHRPQDRAAKSPSQLQMGAQSASVHPATKAFLRLPPQLLFRQALSPQAHLQALSTFSGREIKNCFSLQKENKTKIHLLNFLSCVRSQFSFQIRYIPFVHETIHVLFQNVMFLGKCSCKTILIIHVVHILWMRGVIHHLSNFSISLWHESYKNMILGGQ